MWILDQYYSDFPVYNPALLNLPKSILSKKMSGFKVYNLGEGGPAFSALPPLSLSLSLSPYWHYHSNLGSYPILALRCIYSCHSCHTSPTNSHL